MKTLKESNRLPWRRQRPQNPRFQDVWHGVGQVLLHQDAKPLGGLLPAWNNRLGKKLNKASRQQQCQQQGKGIGSSSPSGSKQRQPPRAAPRAGLLTGQTPGRPHLAQQGRRPEALPLPLAALHAGRDTHWQACCCSASAHRSIMPQLQDTTAARHRSCSSRRTIDGAVDVAARLAGQGRLARVRFIAHCLAGITQHRQLQSLAHAAGGGACNGRCRKQLRACFSAGAQLRCLQVVATGQLQRRLPSPSTTRRPTLPCNPPLFPSAPSVPLP